MPTYSYECSSCGHIFDLFQKMSDAPAETCPECGGPVRRKIGPGAGLIFKGSGFYITDYRSPEYRKRETAESGGGATKSSTKEKDGSTPSESSAPSTPSKEPGTSSPGSTPSTPSGSTD